MKKFCARCKELKRNIEFGRCSDRDDGLNIYCRACIRRKAKEQRDNLRAGGFSVNPRRGPRKPNVIARARRMDKLDGRRHTRDQIVLDAIRKGARTQAEIVTVTGFHRDDVGDALAELMLWQKRIRTDTVRGVRRYFIKAA